MIDRRTFLTGTGAILLVLPRPVAAQGKVYTVGLLSIGTDSARTAEWQPFLDAMRDLGYVKGQNLVMHEAFGDGRPERLPALVAALVQAKVDVVVTIPSSCSWCRIP